MHPVYIALQIEPEVVLGEIPLVEMNEMEMAARWGDLRSRNGPCLS